MIAQQGVAALHHVQQRGGVGMPRQIAADDPAGDIVGRGDGPQLRLAPVPDHAVTVSGAGVEIKIPAAECLLHRPHQFVGFPRVNIARAVVQDGLVRKDRIIRQGHQIAAEGHVVVGQIDADVGGFQRRTPV